MVTTVNMITNFNLNHTCGSNTRDRQSQVNQTRFDSCSTQTSTRMNTTVTIKNEFLEMVPSKTMVEVWNLKDIPEELFWYFKLTSQDWEHHVKRPPNYYRYMRVDPMYQRPSVYQHTSAELCLDKFMDEI